MNNLGVIDGKSIKRELLRKGIHLMGLGYIPFYILSGRSATLSLVAFLTLIAFLVEFFRKKSEVFPTWILRRYEREGLGAHIYFGISMLIVTFFFSPQASFVAIACGSAGDGVAGIVKRLRAEFAGLSMFLASLMVIAILKINIGLFILPAMLAALLATLIEAKVYRIGRFYINDNLSVPLTAAVVYELTSMFLAW